MITKYEIYNESVRDMMSPKMNDDIMKDIENMNRYPLMKNGVLYNMLDVVKRGWEKDDDLEMRTYKKEELIQLSLMVNDFNINPIYLYLKKVFKFTKEKTNILDNFINEGRDFGKLYKKVAHGHGVKIDLELKYEEGTDYCYMLDINGDMFTVGMTMMELNSSRVTNTLFFMVVFDNSSDVQYYKNVSELENRFIEMGVLDGKT